MSSYSKKLSHLPYIGITMGDPAGIGPELCLKVMHSRKILSQCIPLIFGDASILETVASILHLNYPSVTIDISEWIAGKNPSQPSIIHCPVSGTKRIKPGKINSVCGKASYRYIAEAVSSALQKRISAIVTAPICKEAFNLANINYQGHTEILAELTDTHNYCMMLTSEKITVSLVTTHIAISEVSLSLSINKILNVIRLTHQAVRRIKKKQPELIVCALNPHSGEHGLFGNEERVFIEPAIAKAKQENIKCEGPLPPDTAFIPSRILKTDAYICMYHDQGLIPFKMLAFDTGVNVTLGLPIIRTSVDHGTAFDIAWKGVANSSSLIHAIKLAIRLSSG